MKDLVDPGIDIEPDLEALARAESSVLLAAAEEAEADAAAAEAMAAAAKARARATALRRRAEAVAKAADSEGDGSGGASIIVPESVAPVADETSTADADRSSSETDVDEASSATAPSGSSAEPDAKDSVTDDDEKTVDIAVAEPAGSRVARWTARARTGGRRTALVVLATALLVASAATGAFSVWNHHRLTGDERRTAEFSAAARQGVVALTSLDFNRAKDDVQRVLDNSTGAFREDFQSRAEDFTKVVEQSQVTTEGRVTATAVESMTDDSAVVLVAATSQITNSAGAKQEPRIWRLSVTVTRVDGQLKMSKVEFVP
ncbi:hypothetical protein ACWDOP_01255 [Nocardia sp. NPDC003693]